MSARFVYTSCLFGYLAVPVNSGAHEVQYQLAPWMHSPMDAQPHGCTAPWMHTTTDRREETQGALAPTQFGIPRRGNLSILNPQETEARKTMEMKEKESRQARERHDM